MKNVILTSSLYESIELVKKFLDKKFKETSEKENFCYEEISLIYKINNFVNEVKTQKIFSLKTKKVVEKNCIVNGKR